MESTHPNVQRDASEASEDIASQRRENLHVHSYVCSGEDTNFPSIVQTIKLRDFAEIYCCYFQQITFKFGNLTDFNAYFQAVLTNLH